MTDDADRDTGGVIDQHAPSLGSRVRQPARLFEMCLRDGVVEIQVPLSMFDSVDVKAERKKGLDVGFDLETLRILDWLKQEYLLILCWMIWSAMNVTTSAREASSLAAAEVATENGRILLGGDKSWRYRLCTN